MNTEMQRTLLALMVSAMVSITGLATTPGSVDASGNITGQPAGKGLNMNEAPRKPKTVRANHPDGQSKTGAGESEAGETANEAPHSSLPVPPAGWTDFVDPTFGFSIGYPNGFVVQSQNVSKLAQFAPAPTASIFFMNPIMAKGALAGVEPPDLEVRVYQAGAMDSLKSWLASVRFDHSGAAIQPFRNASIDGLKVCQEALIAPGCSVYVLHKARVYQLTPVSREGEAMVETFALLP